jgi:hypothetical protein
MSFAGRLGGIVLGAALSIGGLMGARAYLTEHYPATSTPSPAPWNTAYRELQIFQCMGIVDRDTSFTDWASQLVDKADQLGTTTTFLRSLYYASAESKYPGVGKRCAARYPA